MRFRKAPVSLLVVGTLTRGAPALASAHEEGRANYRRCRRLSRGSRQGLRTH